MVKTGAVIVAAGMSTRMKELKQLMDVGGIGMAERVVINFLNAGVRDICMVTGYRAQEVEKALSRYGISFVRNEAYETTGMFASAGIGLSRMAETCDRVFFSPVDVPFVTEKTLRALMETKEDIAVPVSEGKSGHPVLIATSLIPELLSYDGPEGLRGAMAAVQATRTEVAVEDEGILLDADTREDYDKLIAMHNRQLLRPSVSLRLANEKTFFDPATRTLLVQIGKTGNVRSACTCTGISYSKGWHLIRALEKGLGYRVVERQAGGKDGGRASLTERGSRLIRLYEQMEAELSEMAQIRFDDLFLSSGLF